MLESPVVNLGTELAEPPAPGVARPRRRRRWGLWAAIAWLVLVAALALLADVLPLRDPDRIGELGARSGPGWHQWLGADKLGRDQLSRVIHGARVSILISLVATAMAATLGTLVGLVAGYWRGATDSVLMGAVDILLAFPPLILAIALTSFLGASVSNVVLAIAILAYPAFVRLSRAQTLTFVDRDFVRAARSLGAKRRTILFREIAPHVLPSVLAYSLLIVAAAIVIEATLSFLGLGIPSGTPTWGGIISAGKEDLGAAAHISLIPAAVLFVTVMSLNAVGERLSERTRGGER